MHSICRSLALCLFFSMASVAAKDFGPVVPSDSLWHIASAAQPSQDVTVQQTMLAILKKNPQAFVENNINGLRKGAVLAMPNTVEASDVPAWRAIALIREQNHLWAKLSQDIKSTQPTTKPRETTQVTMVYVEQPAVTEDEVVPSAPQVTQEDDAVTDIAESKGTENPVVTVVEEDTHPAEQLLVVKANHEQLLHLEQMEANIQNQIATLHRKMNYLVAFARTLQSHKGQAKQSHGHMQTYFRSQWYGVKSEPNILMAFVSGLLAILLLFAVSRMQEQPVSRPTPTPELVRDDPEAEVDLGDEYDFMGSDEGIPAKLDLARAYIDMGDIDAAQEIIDEIKAKGNQAQQSEADALAKKLNS